MFVAMFVLFVVIALIPVVIRNTRFIPSTSCDVVTKGGTYPGIVHQDIDAYLNSMYMGKCTMLCRAHGMQEAHLHCYKFEHGTIVVNARIGEWIEPTTHYFSRREFISWLKANTAWKGGQVACYYR